MTIGDPTVREMRPAEVGEIIDYFHQATPEFLETLSVDPSRLPDREAWRERFERIFGQPIHARKVVALVWEVAGTPIGFSNADKIVFGQQAHMHLHIVAPEMRENGYGTACVKASAGLYFDLLKLERLFCEPNAFNVAPYRTLQKAGFRYVKTYETVPGVLNFHQPVTRWLLEKRDLAA